MNVTHLVTAGVVYCLQQRRVIDVIHCYGCEKMTEIDLDRRRPIVTCTQPDEPAAITSPAGASESTRRSAQDRRR